MFLLSLLLPFSFFFLLIFFHPFFFLFVFRFLLPRLRFPPFPCFFFSLFCSCLFIGFVSSSPSLFLLFVINFSLCFVSFLSVCFLPSPFPFSSFFVILIRLYFLFGCLSLFFLPFLVCYSISCVVFYRFSPYFSLPSFLGFFFYFVVVLLSYLLLLFLPFCYLFILLSRFC